MVGGGENSWKEMTVFLAHIFRFRYYYVAGEKVSLRTIGDMNVYLENREATSSSLNLLSKSDTEIYT